MTDSICLLISAAQGPEECCIFSRFILKHILNEARIATLQTSILEETPSQYGILSAVILISGHQTESWIQRWQGTWQWICTSPIRPHHRRKNWFAGVFVLPIPPLTTSGISGEIIFQTCRSSGKGGQHVNKTESAVRATHTASGISVRVESERSQHANKQRALQLLSCKLAQIQKNEQNQNTQQQHHQHHQLKRGNPVRRFIDKHFTEQQSYNRK